MGQDATAVSMWQMACIQYLSLDSRILGRKKMSWEIWTVPLCVYSVQVGSNRFAVKKAVVFGDKIICKKKVRYISSQGETEPCEDCKFEPCPNYRGPIGRFGPWKKDMVNLPDVVDYWDYSDDTMDTVDKINQTKRLARDTRFIPPNSRFAEKWKEGALKQHYNF